MRSTDFRLKGITVTRLLIAVPLILAMAVPPAFAETTEGTLRTIQHTKSIRLTASAASPAVPERVEITYRVSVASVSVGEGHDVLQHDGKTYDLVSESKTSGLRRADLPIERVAPQHRQGDRQRTAAGELR